MASQHQQDAIFIIIRKQIKSTVSERKVIRHMTMSELENFRSKIQIIFLDPCHNQNLERHIKLVIEAFKSVVDMTIVMVQKDKEFKSHQMMKIV